MKCKYVRARSHHKAKLPLKRLIGPAVYVLMACYAVYLAAGVIADHICTAEENAIYYAEVSR